MKKLRIRVAAGHPNRSGASMGPIGLLSPVHSAARCIPACRAMQTVPCRLPRRASHALACVLSACAFLLALVGCRRCEPSRISTSATTDAPVVGLSADGSSSGHPAMDSPCVDAPDRACTVHPPKLLGRAPAGLRIDYPACGLGLAFGPGGGLAALPLSKGAIQLTPLDSTGQPRGAPVQVSITAADSLVSIQPLGHRFLLLTYAHGDCGPVEGTRPQCVTTQLVDADGTPRGQSDVVSLGPHSAITRQVVGDGKRAIMAGIRNQGGPFALQWTVDGDRVVRTDLAAGLSGLPRDYEEGHPPVMGFSGGRWFFITRRKTAGEGTVALYSLPAWPVAPANGAGGELLIDGTGPSFAVDRAALEEDTLWVVGHVFHGPPRGNDPPEVVRIDTTGHVVSREPLRRDRLPQPLRATERVWRLRTEHGALYASMPDGPSVLLAPAGALAGREMAHAQAALVGDAGHAFVYSSFDSTSGPVEVHITVVRCGQAKAPD